MTEEEQHQYMHTLHGKVLHGGAAAAKWVCAEVRRLQPYEQLADELEVPLRILRDEGKERGVLFHNKEWGRGMTLADTALARHAEMKQGRHVQPESEVAGG